MEFLLESKPSINPQWRHPLLPGQEFGVTAIAIFVFCSQKWPYSRVELGRISWLDLTVNQRTPQWQRVVNHKVATPRSCVIHFTLKWTSSCIEEDLINQMRRRLFLLISLHITWLVFWNQQSYSLMATRKNEKKVHSIFLHSLHLIIKTWSCASLIMHLSLSTWC